MRPRGPAPDPADGPGDASFLSLAGIPGAEASTSSPRLLFLDYRAAILYETRIPTEGEDGSWAVVEIVGCREARAGGPNDEAIGQNPWWPDGPPPDGPVEILDSPWLAHRMQIAVLDRRPTDSGASDLHHYVFPHKEGVVECIGRACRLAGTYRSYEAALRVATEIASGPDGAPGGSP